MKNIYIAGWVFYGTRFNFIKKILKLNKGLCISGIITKNKFCNEIDGIKIYSISEYLQIKEKDDVIISHEISKEGKEISTMLSDFELLRLSNFLKSLNLNDDIAKKYNYKITPFDFIETNDLREFFKEGKRPKIKDYLDIESFDVANKLSSIFKSFEWEKFYDFDRGTSIEFEAIEFLSEIYKSGISLNFKILSSTRYYLNILLAVKNRFSNFDIDVSLTEEASNEIKYSYDFYNLCFNQCLAKPSNDLIKSRTMILAKNFDDLLSYSNFNNSRNFLIQLDKSIIEFDRIKKNLDGFGFRYALRQSGVSPNNIFLCGIR